MSLGRMYKLSKRPCKACESFLQEIQWDRDGNLFMYVCDNANCTEFRRPQQSKDLRTSWNKKDSAQKGKRGVE